jgi:hypothetical protein
MKVKATVSAVMSAIGKASGQQVKWSIQVRRQENLREVGSGPTISMWTWSKQASGVAQK